MYIFASSRGKKINVMGSIEVSEEIVKQLRCGNEKAFDTIYHTYYLYLCAIAVYYVHDRQVASEIVNDVFVSLWQKKETIMRPVLPYLRKAIQNASISYLRSSVYTERVATEQLEGIWSFLENHILSSDNPLQVLEKSEMNEFILQKVNELPSKCKAIFKASLYENKTYDEIAKENGISTVTVRVQMKIALSKLRESLGEPYFIAIFTILLKNVTSF